MHVETIRIIGQFLQEAVERWNPVLLPRMRESVAGDLFVGDKQTAAIGIEPYLLREHVGTLREIRMDPRCDRADRDQVGGARGTPVRLAHVGPLVGLTHSVYSVATMRAAKNIFAGVAGIRSVARRPTTCKPIA
ncbi:hypothetical protein ACVMGC_001859 [Bradyrhizobium barranii subsp. barranii]|nr:hypothetical protein [Bradyrhizobium liaoningense]MCP1742764.1 hypothetical protein [Bradyrhizobium japonicum]MCP1781121.1 hypothetical protein [Bradyrhizobium japonicum]MCP1860477.1 hypothetical protein [Bradyrhizobium japonicum]MCP1891239.1 hypothetical protein [Bradyrhizobium japonicum]